MNLQSNDFELFGVPEQFMQDLLVLAERWKDLQRFAHPDRHAENGKAAQRIAMQWSVRINEAYGRLRDPMKRAAYLCELRGSQLGAESNTAMPEAFLAQQMLWREELDEADDAIEVDHLHGRLTRAKADMLQRIGTQLDDDNDTAGAAESVRALMFMQRFGRDITRRRDQLGQ
jgi:molecular chaperone HscB